MSSCRIIRVFPRRTKATPDDEFTFVGDPPLFRPEADVVHVSCTFTWDKAEAERLARAWGRYYSDVHLGGPACGDPGGEFVPGRYLKEGWVITSRGCPNRCDFCLVPSREGKLREMGITEGWNVADNNLLACSRGHIERVLTMLRGQGRAVRLTGGLQASLITPWLGRWLANTWVERAYTAYDRPRQADAVAAGIGILRQAGMTQRAVGCYVLVGLPDDTQEEAEQRCRQVLKWGGVPMAMYYRPPDDTRRHIPAGWAGFVRSWTRPAAIFAKERV